MGVRWVLAGQCRWVAWGSWVKLPRFCHP